MAADFQGTYATPDGDLRGTASPADQKVIAAQVGVMLMDISPTEFKNRRRLPVAAAAVTTTPSPISTLDFGVLASPLCL